MPLSDEEIINFIAKEKTSLAKLEKEIDQVEYGFCAFMLLLSIIMIISALNGCAHSSSSEVVVDDGYWHSNNEFHERQWSNCENTIRNSLAQRSQLHVEERLHYIHSEYMASMTNGGRSTILNYYGCNR